MYIIKQETSGRYLRDLERMSWTDERSAAAAVDLFFAEMGPYMDMPELMEQLIHFAGPITIEKK